MTSTADSADYHSLFVGDVPLLDVRAPVEFEKGAFPTSTNIPLLDDEQREAIGTEYKARGQESAISLGWEMLSPALKQQRQERWLAYINNHPKGYLYCFRGGLRSKITQQLIAETDRHYPRIIGGYKAMRQFLTNSLETLSGSIPLVVIAGRTCSGKTLVIEQLENAADLEGLARHRGSAFGAHIQGQPSQINFENALAIKLLKHQHRRQGPLFVEDEGKLIGRLSLPQPLKQSMRQSALVEVDTDIEQRVKIALKDYVIDSVASYRQQHGEQLGLTQFSKALLNNLARIKKRLGGVNYKKINTLFEQAIDNLRKFDRVDGFVPAIECLLQDYYDPMYDYQRRFNQGKTILKGDIDTVIAWAREHCMKSGKHLFESKSDFDKIAKSVAGLSVARP